MNLFVEGNILNI